MKLSIIIPVYNVEKYIARCLDSVLKQDIAHSEYEIIVVNDGSPDNSTTIVAEYEKKYSNIKHHIKENGGPSSARNEGIELATGDYIWFVDADDTIKTNCLNALLTYVFAHRLDFCEFNYIELCGDRRIFKGLNRWIANTTLSNIAYIKNCAIPYAPWNYIVKREVISHNNLRFIEGIYHEDREFNIRLLEHCNRISYYNNAPNGLYYYFIEREGSTMTNKDAKHYLKRIDSYITILTENEKIFPYNPKVKNYSYYVQRLMNDIITHSLLPLISTSQIPDKSSFYRNMFITNNLKYKPDVYDGLSRYKFRILSQIKKNYRLTIFFLQLFDTAGIILNKIKNIRK